MPLDDREQRILEEIERQFYQEDPKLAETVRNTTLATFMARRARWAALVFAGGLILMLVFFTRNLAVALAGFLAMVGAAFWIVSAVHNRNSSTGGESLGDWWTRTRRRWRKDG